MATRKLIGNLIDNRGKPQARAELWLSAPGVAAAEGVTEEDGSFEFLLDESWPAGSYKLEAPPNERALGAWRKVTIAESGPPAPLVLSVAPRHEVKERQGLIFLGALIVTLLVVGHLYLWLHDFSFTDLRQGAPTTVEAPADAEPAATADPPPEPGPFFWSERPQILLETLFWALAATLIRLIFKTGNYLYQRSFLASAIPHHVALVFSVPVLAVLISFVLTLINISVELSEVTLELDMDNVYVAILVAALIGFAPWKAWGFLQDLADALFARLGRLFDRQEAPDS